MYMHTRWSHASRSCVRGAHLLGLLEGIREAARLLVGCAPQVARAKRALVEAARLHQHVHGLDMIDAPELRPAEARNDAEALARVALRQWKAHCGDALGSDYLHEQGQAVAPVHERPTVLALRHREGCVYENHL